MRKLFISSDLEGSAGISCWDEIERFNPHDYDYFADEMSREVAAACKGAHEAGIEDILIKDAHSTGRNINPRLLPEYARIMRGWAHHPYCMMYGLDKSFEGVVFTGYHSGAMTNANPLAHTMTRKVSYAKLNGEYFSELQMNCLTAAYEGVPVYAVTGDKGVCEWVHGVNPNIVTCAVTEGIGEGTISLQPDAAAKRIRAAVRDAIQSGDPKACAFPLPAHFEFILSFVEHFRAARGSFYPGAEQIDARTLRFVTDDYFEVLRFYQFMF